MTPSTTASTARGRAAELVRFALVGLSSTALYFGIYAGLALLGTPYAAASVAAFLVSACWGYVLHHRYTFKTGGGDTGSLVGWLALQATLLGVNLALLSILIHAADLDRILAQLLVLPVVPLLSYLISRRLIFTRR